MTLKHPDLEGMAAAGCVCMGVALATSIAAGRLYLPDPAVCGAPIIDHLDDPR